MTKDFERGVMFGIITMIAKRSVDEMFQGRHLPPTVDLALRAKLLQVAVISSCQFAGIEQPTDEEVSIMSEALAKASSHGEEVFRRIFQEEGR